MPDIYFDNSATTCVRPEVQEAMLPYLSDKWGNPSSSHQSGSVAKRAIAEARKSVARLLSCESAEVYFTPCATYSNNTAILGRARFVEANGLGRHMITTAIEHPSCAGPAGYLESLGWELTYLPVDREGLIDLHELKKKIKKETSIISIMWANNEIGALEPVSECALLAKAAGVFFHTDAVQLPGKVSLNVNELPLDALSLSAHKFYGPKGIGALYLRRCAGVMPIIFGGGQEMGLFPGTEPVANIVALGKAAQLAFAELEANADYLRKLQAILTERLVGHQGIRLSGPLDAGQRIPGHLSLIVPGVEGESVVLQAALQGLCISAASACKSGGAHSSPVLSALGYSDGEALGSLRVTAGRFNTESECEKASEIILKIVLSLQNQAPAGSRPGTAPGA